ncbi:MAG: hypothetical protein QOH97_5242 [Actinoplanes sp.]|nr:hypothetical protein [Actinoplanes sp.]
MDLTDLAFALIIGTLGGALGHLLMPRNRAVPLWFTAVTGVVAAVLGSLAATAVGVSGQNGVEWIERTLQIVFVAATVLNIRALAALTRATRRR